MIEHAAVALDLAAGPDLVGGVAQLELKRGLPHRSLARLADVRSLSRTRAVELRTPCCIRDPVLTRAGDASPPARVRSTQLVQLAMCLTRHLKHVEGELAKAAKLRPTILFFV